MFSAVQLEALRAAVLNLKMFDKEDGFTELHSTVKSIVPTLEEMLEKNTKVAVEKIDQLIHNSFVMLADGWSLYLRQMDKTLTEVVYTTLSAIFPVYNEKVREKAAEFYSFYVLPRLDQDDKAGFPFIILACLKFDLNVLPKDPFKLDPFTALFVNKEKYVQALLDSSIFTDSEKVGLLMPKYKGMGIPTACLNYAMTTQNAELIKVLINAYAHAPFASVDERISALRAVSFEGNAIIHVALNEGFKVSIKTYIEALMQSPLSQQIKAAVLFSEPESEEVKKLLQAYAQYLIKKPQNISWSQVNWIGLANFNLPLTEQSAIVGGVLDTLIYVAADAADTVETAKALLESTSQMIEIIFEQKEGLMKEEIEILTNIQKDISIVKTAGLAVDQFFTEKQVNLIGENYAKGFMHKAEHTLIAQEMAVKTFAAGESPKNYLEQIYFTRLANKSTILAIAIKSLFHKACQPLIEASPMLNGRRNSDPSGKTKTSAQPSKAAERRASFPFYNLLPSKTASRIDSAVDFKGEL